MKRRGSRLTCSIAYGGRSPPPLLQDTVRVSPHASHLIVCSEWVKGCSNIELQVRLVYFSWTVTMDPSASDILCEGRTEGTQAWIRFQ